MRFPSTRPWPLLLILAVALAIRLWFAQGLVHKADALFLGFMAGDIARGAAFPLVYYGQNYMGTLEAWLTAPLFLLTGPTWWGIGFAPIFVSTLGVISFYLLGHSLAGERAGLLAASLWAAATPFSMMFYTITPRGCYPEIICGGALALWYATECWKGRTFTASAAAGMGVLLGLLLWASVIAAPLIITVALFILIAGGRRVINKANLLAMAGFLAGAALYLPQALRASGERTLHANPAQMVDRIPAFAQTVRDSFLPYAFLQPPPWLTGAGWFSLILFLAPFCLLAFLAVARPSPRRGGVFLPLLVYTLLFLAAYLTHEKAMELQTRYVTPLFVPLIAATAMALARLEFARGAVAWALVAALAVSSFAQNRLTFDSLHKEGADQMAATETLYGTLREHGIRSLVIGDYELGTRLAWMGRVRGDSLAVMDYSGSRDVTMSLAVERDLNAALIIPPANAAWIAEQYRVCCGDNFKVIPLGPYQALLPGAPTGGPAVTIPPSRWVINDQSRPLGDRKFSTTIATDAPVTVELASVEAISRIRAIFGHRRPAQAAWLASMNGVQWSPLTPYKDPSPLIPVGPKMFTRTSFDPEREWEEWRFAPVKARFLRLDVRQPAGALFDIHELFIYAPGGTGGAGAIDVDELRALVRRENVTTLTVDRWTAASLHGASPDVKVVMPSLRSLATGEITSRWAIRPGFAALVAPEDGPELTERLDLGGAKYKSLALGGHTLYMFTAPAGETWWTGFTLIDW